MLKLNPDGEVDGLDKNSLGKKEEDEAQEIVASRRSLFLPSQRKKNQRKGTEKTK